MSEKKTKAATTKRVELLPVDADHSAPMIIVGLRDMFASSIANGTIAHSGSPASAEAFAGECYKLADEMIKAGGR